MNIDQKYPLVTVIAACYNQEKYLVETLDSIKNQTYPNLQLIFWDDCSKDNSSQLIESWISENKVECSFLKHTTNKGICKSLNEAFALAKGKYLQIIAMDDILLPDKIEKHVELLENEDKDYALVFSDAALIDSNGILYQNKFIALHKTYLSLESGNFYNDLVDENFIPAMSVLLKTEAVRRVGVWDENLAYEDYDMWLRLAKEYDFMYDNNTTVKYRLHSTNLHKNIQNAGITFFRICLKHVDNSKMNSNCIAQLHELYKSNNPDLKPVSELYFGKAIANTLMLKMIRAKLPYVLYRTVQKFKSLFQ